MKTTEPTQASPINSTETRVDENGNDTLSSPPRYARRAFLGGMAALGLGLLTGCNKPPATTQPDASPGVPPTTETSTTGEGENGEGNHDNENGVDPQLYIDAANAVIAGREPVQPIEGEELTDDKSLSGEPLFSQEGKAEFTREVFAQLTHFMNGAHPDSDDWAESIRAAEYTDEDDITSAIVDALSAGDDEVLGKLFATEHSPNAYGDRNWQESPMGDDFIASLKLMHRTWLSMRMTDMVNSIKNGQPNEGMSVEFNPEVTGVIDNSEEHSDVDRMALAVAEIQLKTYYGGTENPNSELAKMLIGSSNLSSSGNFMEGPVIIGGTFTRPTGEVNRDGTVTETAKMGARVSNVMPESVATAPNRVEYHIPKKSIIPVA